MFKRFRKPTPKPSSRPYRLNLTPLESRDVPATWHIEMLSPGIGNAGDTDATITGSLAVGKADVDADDAAAAIGKALTGGIR